MAQMAKIANLDRLLKLLKKRRLESAAGDGASVLVGYTAEYAIYVHENLEAQHPVGQAKFLEQPLREMTKELVADVKRDVAAGIRLRQALLKAGMKLQRASQKLCPVDTGNMRASAFTRLEGESP